MSDSSSPTPLLDLLKIKANNPDLFAEALCHGSRRGQNGPGNRNTSNRRSYERLEFLGDRVLGLIISEHLYEAYPDATEGELARRHAALVDESALATAAGSIGLAPLIQLGASEAAGGGRENPSILADVTEAVIAAIYLDQGLEAARALVLKHWATLDAKPFRDPKTRLQEWAQSEGLPLPLYQVLSRKGADHAPQFRIRVSVAGYPDAEGEAGSKQGAEKAAAAEFLKMQKVD